MPDNGRPKVGPADPETRRKKLREVLDGEAAEAEKRRKEKKPTLRDAVQDGLDEADGKKKPAPKKQLKRRFGPEGKTEEELGA